MRDRLSLLIRGGHLIDPAQHIDAPHDVLLRNGHVESVARPGELDSGSHEVIEAEGLIVAPGFIDIHVHLREPGQSHKETIATGAAAAAAGGFTSVCCMPNTSPVNDSPEITRWMLHSDRAAAVNVFPIAAATIGSLGEQLTDFRALRSAGAVGFSDDGRPILADAIMRDALRAAAELDSVVIQHAEDTRLTPGCSMHFGPTAFRLGLRGMTVEAESAIVERDIKLVAELKGARYHVAHLSTRKALDAVRRAKDRGLPVTCEVTPHHFTLLDEHVGSYNTNMKMNPPLRSADDRAALLEGLADGAIDCIATDHAPHAHHEKLQEFDRAPMGIIGLESAFGIACQVLHHHHGLPLRRLVALLSSNPARVVGLAGSAPRGTLAPGATADVTLFDPVALWTYSAADSRSKSRNTPFDGWQLRGRVAKTIVAGKPF